MAIRSSSQARPQGLWLHTTLVIAAALIVSLAVSPTGLDSLHHQGLYKIWDFGNCMRTQLRECSRQPNGQGRLQGSPAELGFIIRDNSQPMPGSKQTAPAAAGLTVGNNLAASPFPFSVPYFAPASELPAPLPSAEEIVAAGKADAQSFKTTNKGKVIRYGEHYLVKYGDDINAHEGISQLFAQEAAGIPVPRVYAIFRDDAAAVVPPSHRRKRYTYIVMEYIEGESLEALWDGLDAPRKADIAAQLRASFDRLRRVPAPGYFGKLGEESYNDFVFGPSSRDGKNSTRSRGPFASARLFGEGILGTHRRDAGHAPERAAFLRRLLPSVLGIGLEESGDPGPAPVFSHGDLARKNVVVRKRDGVPFLIDWEFSGWYPAWWDYSVAIIGCMTNVWKEDWHASVGMILDEHFAEYTFMQMFIKETVYNHLKRSI